MVRSEYIPNHPNYLITEDGEVINIKRRRVMQPGDNGHRSIHVYLRGDVPNGGKSYQVRKLVADAFLHRLHELVVRDRRKAGSDVRLDHPPLAPPALIDEHLQGVVR